MKYLISKFVNASFEETLLNLKQELGNEEFIVLSELDLKDILNEKLEVEIGNHKILNIFNPAIVYKGLTVDRDISVMFPFSMAVRELKGGRIRICVINYSIAMRFFSGNDLIAAASATTNKLKRILSKL